jgi:predicted esterase
MIRINCCGQNFSKFQVDTVSAAGNKFLLYLPVGYNPQNTHPLLVSLHGAASIGNALKLILTQSAHAPPARLIQDNKWPASNPMMVLSPQLKRDINFPNQNDQEWDIDMIDEVIEYVKTNYSVNSNKVYLTGISLGAAATWKYAAQYPSKIAAINPMSGITDVSSACSLKDIPIWAFHGSQDPFVLPDFSISMINAINTCSSGSYKPKLNILQTRGHDVWNNVWDGVFGFDVFNWMLQFTKGSTANIPPYVKVEQDLKVISRIGEFYLNADAFDWDGEITSIQWTQTSGNSLNFIGNKKILKILSLPAGTYNFQLSVIDNSGGTSSKSVTIVVVDNASTNEPQVLSMSLINGSTNQTIQTINESLIINKALVNISEINIQAICNGFTNSVRFAVNTDKSIMRTNSPFRLVSPRSSPEWEIEVGDYTVCAVPHPLQFGGGMSGVSQCYKISVFDQPYINYYAKPNTDLSLVSSWGTQLDGQGSSPDSLSGHYVIFNVTQQNFIGSPLSVDGVASEIIVKSGGELQIQDSFTGIISAEENATVNVLTNQSISLGSIHPNSLFIFSGINGTIPIGAYGNVSMIGGGAVNFESGETIISGNLNINDVELRGVLNNASKINVSGDVIMSGLIPTSDNNKISIEFTDGQVNHTLTTNGNISLHELRLSNQSELALNSNEHRTIILGSATGGGLKIDDLSSFDISNHTLEIVELGTINSSNQKGKIGLENSNLVFSTVTSQISNLYPLQGKNNLLSIEYNAVNSPALIIQDELSIKNSLHVIQGTINSNGFLKLLSTSDNSSAFVKSLGPNSHVIGNIIVQRHMDGEGRIYRYISSPVTGAAVSQLQNFFPITGNFLGANNDAGLSSTPSMYFYDENMELGSEWVPFPAANQSNDEVLVAGKGYSAFIREDAMETTYELNGYLNQGPINFNLSPGSASESDGWNLIGNPYASPIKWDPINLIGWNVLDLSSSIYVRDNNFNNPRFLSWDGEIGSLTDGIIASGQSFWVQSSSSTPSLSIDELAKSESSSSIFYRTKNDLKYIEITLSNGSIQDKAFIKFKKNGVNNYLKSEDTYKKPNDFLNLSSLSTDSISLAINTISKSFCSQTIPLIITGVESGTYSLKFDLVNSDEVYSLFDSYLNSSVKLNIDNIIEFEVNNEPRSSGERFMLIIEKESISKTLHISAPGLCNKQPKALIIENPQDKVFYSVKYNDNSISRSYSGSTNPISILLDSNKLITGTNLIDLYGGQEYCEVEFLRSIRIDIVDVEPFNTSSKTLTVCKGEDAILEFETLPDSFFYRIYSDSTLLNFEDFNSSSVVIYAISKPSIAYFSAISSSGCNSDPKPIFINVSSLENPILKIEKNTLVSSFNGLNEWYLNGVSIGKSQGPTFIPTESGEYSVGISDGICTKYSKGIVFLITDTELIQSITISPNPVHTQFNLIGTLNDITELNIYSSTGSLVFNTTINPSKGDHYTVTLPFGLSSGLYFMILETKGDFLTRKFIIQD